MTTSNGSKQLIVSFQYPHKILKAIGTEDIYQANNLLGYSLDVLFGPGGDSSGLRSAIHASSALISVSIPIIIFDHNYQEIQMVATCLPWYDVDEDRAACLVSLCRENKSYYEMMNKSFENMQDYPAVLANAQAPNDIVRVNEQTVSLFGLCENQLVGCPLEKMLAPSSDMLRLRMLLDAGAAGCTAQVRLQVLTCASECPLVFTCQPVHYALGASQPRLLLVSFAEDCELAASPGDAVDAALPFLPAAAFRPACHCAPTSAKGLLTIYPRRKAGRPGLDQARRCSAGPVLVTLELLQGLSHLPLCQASDLLGISPTALKRACRKVGLARWPVRRGGGGAGAPWCAAGVASPTHSAGSDSPAATHFLTALNASTGREQGLGATENKREPAFAHGPSHLADRGTESVADCGRPAPDCWWPEPLCASAACSEAAAGGGGSDECRHPLLRDRADEAFEGVLSLFGDELSLEVPVLDLPDLW